MSSNQVTGNQPTDPKTFAPVILQLAAARLFICEEAEVAITDRDQKKLNADV